METKTQSQKNPLQLQRIIDELTQQLVEKNNVIEQQRDALEHHKHQQQLLEERIRWMVNGRYRPKNETNDRQPELFNEAEVLVDQAESSEQDDQTVTVKTHKRRGKRSPLPKDAKRIRIEHDLPDEYKLCRCCGEPMSRIGEDQSEQLDIIPEKLVVLEHIRPRYACNHCHDDIISAPMPKQPIPKSNASAGLLAYLIVMKYVDGLPLNRIEKIFKRLDYHQPRTTLARWMIQVSALCEMLVQRLLIHAQQQPFLHVDETTIQVLKEPDRAAQNLSYMWVIRAGPKEKQVVYYHYAPSRGSQVLEQLLPEYEGYLQSDGWSAYPAYANKHPEVTLVGCFAHVQVKFKDCLKAQEKLKSDTTFTQSRCRKAMSMIRKLYDVEEQCKTFDDELRQAYRQQHSIPILQSLRAWVDKTRPKVVKESLLGKAVHYLHNQWDKLIRYTEHGCIPIDNNPVEQIIRPFVIGRNAWLFSDTPSGAKASAVLYTLVQTARLNGLEPYRYLRKILADLPNIDPEQTQKLDKLLPWQVDKNDLTIPDY